MCRAARVRQLRHIQSRNHTARRARFPILESCESTRLGHLRQNLWKYRWDKLNHCVFPQAPEKHGAMCVRENA